ncbi:MAG: OmpA family protein [Rickettsiales bacterium]
MTFSRTLCSLALVFTALVSMPAKAEMKDTVSDDRRQVITNTWGNCVRTKWNAPDDECAPKAAPAPTPVVQAPPPVQIARDARTVYFDFDKDTLTPEATQKLDALANTIRTSRGIVSASVVGYADQMGSNEYNIKLSERRARAVESYLSQRVSIPTSVGKVRWVGESNPVTNCDNIKKRADKIACLAADRRVEVEFKYQQ